MITAIACVDEKWGIGRDNDLLFFIPSDLAHFKETTINNNILVGRKTLESFPFGKPLPKRRNIIVTGNENYSVKGAQVVSSIEEGINEMNNEGFICGGASIYEQGLKYCDKCIITKVRTDGNADRFFPNLEKNKNFNLVEESEPVTENGYVYTIQIYERIGA